MLQELRGDIREVEAMNFASGFWERQSPFSMPEKITVLPPTSAKFWRHRPEPPALVTTCMAGSLPEASPAKVYLLHKMRFADVFFMGTSTTDKTPSFDQSLQKKTIKP